MGIGAIFTTYFAYQDFVKGDLVGAGLLVTSGAAGIIPAVGTTVSIGLDVVYIVRMVYNMLYQADKGLYPGIEWSINYNIFMHHSNPQEPPMGTGEEGRAIIASRLPEIGEVIKQMILDIIAPKEKITKAESKKYLSEWQTGEFTTDSLDATQFIIIPDSGE